MEYQIIKSSHLESWGKQREYFLWIYCHNSYNYLILISSPSEIYLTTLPTYQMVSRLLNDGVSSVKVTNSQTK